MNPIERARQYNMPYFTPDRAESVLARLMMEHWHRTASPELLPRIADAYQAFTNAPLRQIAAIDDDGYTTPQLKGPPGHGKSAAVYSAAKRVAELMGMTFHRAVGPKTYSINDMVVLKMELTGETSSLSTRGIFQAAEHNNRAVTRRIPYDHFVRAQDAGLVVLLLDDLSSALDTVQTSLLGLLRDRHVEGEDLSAMFVVATGNLGIDDGTSVTQGSSAVTGRCLNWYVQDTIEAFTARMQRRYGHDDIGDGYVLGFLASHPEMFDPKDEQMSDTQAPRPQPRTWEAAITTMRSLTHLHRNAPESIRAVTGASTIVEAARTEVAGSVGYQAANAFGEYLGGIFTLAVPLAQALMSKPLAESADSLERVAAEAGMGVRTTEGRNESAFQFQFASAVCEQVLARVRSAPQGDMVQVLKTQLSHALAVLNAPYLHSKREAAILMSNQSLALWNLGRALTSLPPFIDPALSMGRSVFKPALAREIADEASGAANETLMALYGSKVYSPDSILRNVYGPLSDDGAAIAKAA